ncbi:MAG: hypothetical protein PGN18_02530 [Pedobacter terrae]
MHIQNRGFSGISADRLVGAQNINEDTFPSTRTSRNKWSVNTDLPKYRRTNSTLAVCTTLFTTKLVLMVLPDFVKVSLVMEKFAVTRTSIFSFSVRLILMALVAC